MASSTIQYFSASVRPNVYVIYNSCLGTIIAEYLEYEYQGARHILIRFHVATHLFSKMITQDMTKCGKNIDTPGCSCITLCTPFLFLPYFGVINYLHVTHLLHFDPY